MDWTWLDDFKDWLFQPIHSVIIPIRYYKLDCPIFFSTNLGTNCQKGALTNK